MMWNRFIGMFFAPDGDVGGGEDNAVAAKAQAEATAATAKAQKTANDAMANISAMKETLEQMGKGIEGLNSQVGHAKRQGGGELKEGEENKVTAALEVFGEGLKDVLKRLEGQEEKTGQMDLAALRAAAQKEFNIADDDMKFIQGTSASTLTESAKAFAERFKVSADPKTARSNALLPSHGAPADGADPSAITEPPPLVKGGAAKRGAAMLDDFVKNPGRMHN